MDQCKPSFMETQRGTSHYKYVATNHRVNAKDYSAFA